MYRTLDSCKARRTLGPPHKPATASNRPSRGWYVLVWLLAIQPWSGTAQAQESAWQTGRALEQQLRTPLSATLKGLPLRDGITRLSQATRVAMWLDRRVDPSSELDVQLDEVPLAEALDVLAADHGLGWHLYDAVVCFAPDESLESLRRAQSKTSRLLGRLPAGLRRQMLVRRAWQWDELAEPRLLLTAIAEESSLPIEGLDRVPHDLWPAADLPPLRLADRMLFIATQFDLEIDYDAPGGKLVLRPAQEEDVDESGALAPPSAE